MFRHDLTQTLKQAPVVATDARVLWPVIKILLIAFMWGSLLLHAEAERARAAHRAVESSRELMDTYYSYMMRALQEIDQTLRMVSYVAGTSGGMFELASLDAAGLLPPEMFFTVAVTDEQGLVRSTTRPSLTARDVSAEEFFTRLRHSNELYVSELRRADDEWYIIFSRSPVDLASTGASQDEVRAFLDEVDERADVAFLMEESPRAFARALDGVDRVTRVVRAMKEFSYPGDAEFGPANINPAIVSTVEVARSEYKHIARLALELQPLPPVMCCLGEINQVVLNLVVNAAHAIDESGQDASTGVIRIATRKVDDYVEIAIADNGCGIPKEVARRVFDPFFTTKEVGKGRGQGLAFAHRVVVMKHGGTLDFQSEVGRGTTFVVRLPIAGPASQASVAESRAA